MRKIVFFLWLAFIALQAVAQNRTVSGVVTSPAKEPLPGVSVLIPGVSRGTTTNAMGLFSLSVPARVTSLEFSYLGFKKVTVAIGSGNSMNVTLQTEQSELETLVVSALTDRQY